MTKTKLAIKGMHCASCVTVVERGLKKTDGVTNARVNLATETAEVEFDKSKVDESQLIEAVKKKGYGATVFGEQDKELEELEKTAELRRSKFILLLAISLALPALVIGMVFMQIPYRIYILFFLATPVQFIAGFRFYQGMWAALKNKSANMDTLIVVGTTAAYVFSFAVMLFATPEEIMAGGPENYFETSAVLIAFVLIGKYLEDKAKGKTSSAIKN